MPEAALYGSVSFNLVLPTLKGLGQDEPALSLYERDELVENSTTIRRIQTIRVIRDDRPVEFSRDLGPGNALIAPFAMICMFEDTVAEAMLAADLRRGDKGLDLAMAEHLQSFNVIEAAIEKATQMQQFLKTHPATVRQLERHN